MRIKDLQEGVNIHKGCQLQNFDDSSTVVWELNKNVLNNWIIKMRFTGEEQCHFSRTINDCQEVIVDSIEQSRNNFINEKAATLKSCINNKYINAMIEQDRDFIANKEFGMDYWDLGSGEQEWVDDELDIIQYAQERNQY
tara:strand:+ start:1383 stop:1802 length:420 start_codon:yes stop_codon:yes gene_type:complete